MAVLPPQNNEVGGEFEYFQLYCLQVVGFETKPTSIVLKIETKTTK